MTAPERIWAEMPEIFDGMGFWQENKSADLVEYIRAGLAAVPAQVNEEQNTEQRKRFWNWLPLAYRDGHIGEHAKFTKYNMEVAFAAGAEAEAKRMWVGLTEEDLFDIASVNFGEPDLLLFVEMGKLVQKELKELNT